MIKAVVTIYLIGLVVFYSFALDGERVWPMVYYIWDKTVGGGMLLWYALYIATRRNKMLVPVVWFSSIRLLWEYISAATGVSVSNSVIVAVLFLVLTLIVGILCFMEKSPLVRFLEKNIF